MHVFRNHTLIYITMCHKTCVPDKSNLKNQSLQGNTSYITALLSRQILELAWKVYWKLFGANLLIFLTPFYGQFDHSGVITALCKYIGTGVKVKKL